MQEELNLKKKFGMYVAALCAAALIIAGSTPVFASAAAADAADAEFSAPSVILTEAETGTVLYEKNSKEHRPIASMVKIMTLLLTFENIESGELTESETVTVSENAASMGGSQAFLDAHASYPVKDLIKSIVVASANDSCVAVAERIAGSVDGFVTEMNERAARLGMENTNFVNCTGLPAPGQYSCAYDAAIMFGELVRHDIFFDYAGEWMFDFHHPSGRDTVLTNTNKMIRSYEGCDGGKTGFTNEAMYCLSATAKRGDTRLIGVITGASSSKSRNAEMAKLFDRGFAEYSTRKIIFAGVPLESVLEVGGSKEGFVGVAPASDGFMLTKRGEDNDITYSYEFYDVELPLEKGSTVGKMTAFSGGKVVAESELVTTGTLSEKTYFDVVKDLLDGM